MKAQSQIVEKSNNTDQEKSSKLSTVNGSPCLETPLKKIFLMPNGNILVEEK